MLFLTFQNSLYLVELQTDNYPITSVRVLSWLDNPGIELVEVLRILLDGLPQSIVVLAEFKILVIVDALLDVEGQR